MKKILALALALMLCLCSVAFADEVTYAPSDVTSFTITKTYTSDESFNPGETLKFTVTADENNPDTTKLIVVGNNNEYTVDTNPATNDEITVSVPSYDKVGIYEYTITEVAGDTAGVTTYDASTIYVVVMVEYDNDNHKLVIGNPEDENADDGIYYFIKDVSGNKKDNFTNVFETNDFTVAKDVQGNMANENDEFEVTITLTTDDEILTSIMVAGEEVKADAWSNGTYTTKLTLSESGGAKTISDVPYGVTVTIEETNAGDYDLLGYKTNGGDLSETAPEFVIGEGDATSIVVVNEKTTDIQTGISLDNAPYMIVLALVVVAGVMMMKKRSYNA